MNQNVRARDDEDAALLEAVAERRDREAYRALFDRYYPRVFVFVRRRLEDQELAREITSDVFLEVWASAPTFRGESKISSWIFGIARFKCLEALRQRGRLKRSRVIATEDEVIAQVPENLESATQLDAREELRRVVRLLGRIPQDQRDALTWTVIEGQSLDEVAQRQQVTRETVKTRISRARRSLRRMMGSASEDAADGMNQEGA
ncbi:MAG: RNA polymerase sigma factor [Myxococcota bacterium]